MKNVLGKLDYGDWLDAHPEKFPGIIAGWIRVPEIHDFQIAVTLKACEQPLVGSIVEIGCGGGNLAQKIPDNYNYIGFDQNEALLSLCREHCPNKRFVRGDIRNISPEYCRDLVLCFGTLKHFGLHEWDQVFSKVIACGTRYALLEVPNPRTKGRDEDMSDEGCDFPHVWISYSHMEAAGNKSGYEIIWTEDNGRKELAYLFKKKEG